MKLSLCIATFNEEKNIHYPLDSTIDFVDEVIIVDGGSTDKTIEIAKSYGKKVKIIVSENPIMFHKNKQKAIEAAQGEWILQLDADEELTKELKEEIKMIVGNDPRVVPNNGFWIPRKNWFLTRFLMKGGQYPDYTIRLYRNGYARFPCMDVHENVEIITPVIPAKAGIQASGNKSIGYLQNPILHYADPDFSRYLMRWDRYTTLEAKLLTKTMKQSNNGTINGILMFLNYFVIKPKLTFLSMYFRHKGFLDGFPGFVFALFSSIRFWAIYIKWRTKKNF